MVLGFVGISAVAGSVLGPTNSPGLKPELSNANAFLSGLKAGASTGFPSSHTRKIAAIHDDFSLLHPRPISTNPTG